MKFITLFILAFALGTASSKASDCVVLLHGLARTSASFAKMEHVLQDSGFVVVNKSYPSTKHTIEELAEENLLNFIAECPENSTIHFVTHSLGGILVRQYLEVNQIENMGRVVMLAPPNKGSEVTDRLKDWWLYKTINGPAGIQLGTDSLSTPNQLGPAVFDLGIIAGTETVNPILSTMLPNPDDGKVSVENTKLEGMTDHMQVPVSHTFILRNKTVIDQVIHFLDHGEFKHSD